MTNWRERCAELLQAIDDDVLDVADGPRFQAAIDRTRAELAQPEPKGPSDEELLQLAIDTRLYRFQATAGDPIQYEMTEQQVRAYGRAVWARAQAARPAIEPVPVGERLPGPEDCDAEGRCWYLHIKEDGVVAWFKQRPTRISRCSIYHLSHWLPHYALPTSQESPS